MLALPIIAGLVHTDFLNQVVTDPVQPRRLCLDGMSAGKTHGGGVRRDAFASRDRHPRGPGGASRRRARRLAFADDFRGLNSIAAELTGVNHQRRASRDTPLVHLIPGGRRAARHWFMPSSAIRSAHLPGTTERYAGRDQLEAGLRQPAAGSAARRDGILAQVRHPVRLARRRRHDRARARRGRRGRLVWRSHPAVCVGVGRARRSRPTREASEKLHRRQGSGVRGDRAADRDARCRRPNTTSSSSWPAGFATKGWSAIADPERLGGGKRGQSALSADGAASRADSVLTNSSCSISGASSIARARSTPTSRGWVTPDARVARPIRAGVRGRGGARAMPRCALVQQRRGRRPRTARLGGRSRGVPVLRSAGLRRSHPAPDGPQPRRVGARQRRQHGRLRDARRSAPAAPAPASRSSRASTSTTSACGRKST